MQPSRMPIETLKERMKGSWMAGDFGEIARFTATEAEAFVNRLPIQPGMQVLDVACGTGNLAVPAARKGAVVTGVDIAPNLIEQARARADQEGLKAEFREGDAEQLPFPDAQFDTVMSMFGAMFAPRPDLVASELVRVCRPGGLIAMANWTPEGFVGKSFALTSRYVPPPEGIPAPVLWGKEEVVRERLGKFNRQVETVRRKAKFEYPFDSKRVVEFFRRYFGPTQMAFSKLDDAGQSTLAKDLENLWTEYNEGSPHETIVSAEYLEVRVT
ncbi:MAG: Methyltransferase type 11 [Acidobacteriaceae bacterium]|jgi:ubiquinone/menaquinone biosynthesis C-methylase UbiE|nr:Methyltransferase type 11 [Acidobacteriaceae bacterium]